MPGNARELSLNARECPGVGKECPGEITLIITLVTNKIAYFMKDSCNICHCKILFTECPAVTKECPGVGNECPGKNYASNYVS